MGFESSFFLRTTISSFCWIHRLLTTNQVVAGSIPAEETNTFVLTDSGSSLRSSQILRVRLPAKVPRARGPTSFDRPSRTCLQATCSRKTGTIKPFEPVSFLPGSRARRVDGSPSCTNDSGDRENPILRRGGREPCQAHNLEKPVRLWPPLPVRKHLLLFSSSRRPRTLGSQSRNTGSNPVGNAKKGGHEWIGKKHALSRRMP